MKVERSKVNVPTNIDYNWIAGFFSDKSYFFVDVHIFKSLLHKIGYNVVLRLLVSQHVWVKLFWNN